MTRSCRVAVVIAFLLAGSAFGQTTSPAPAGDPAIPPLALPPATQPGPGAPFTGVPPQPLAAPLPLDAHAGDSSPFRYYGNVDYLLGWVRPDRLPALVTTSPPGTPTLTAGTLGNGAPSSVLFGAGPVNSQVRSGIRAGLVGYIDDAGVYAVEAGFFALESQATGFLASSDGSTILARPFTDTTTGQPSSVQVAYPGVSSGSIQAIDAARNLWGFNLDLRESWINKPWMRVDALLGYRFLRYDEHLFVQQTINPTGGAFAAGTSVNSTDAFGTRNIFNGVDLGFRGEFWYNSLSLETYGKVAVGVLNRTSLINGETTVNVPGSAPAVTPGGVLTQASNLGTHTGHTDTSVPELGLNLGWQITDNVRFRVGYTVLWWLNVVRPGSQIDTGLNPGQFGGGTAAAGTVAHPLLTGQYTDLWVQAISASLEFRY